MTTNSQRDPAPHFLLRILMRKNVLAGLMFVTIAALGLWLSRHYPVGSALRMSTGYVPRLLCWLLMGLGVIVLVQGLCERPAPAPEHPVARSGATMATFRPIVAVAAGLIAFALALETLGLVVAILLLVAIASQATRELKPWETLATAAGLSALSWAIFVFGIGLAIPVWPDW